MSVIKPTLTYFNIPARAEVARLILVDAGVDYQWNPVSDWASTKTQLTAAGKLPFGQIPLYEEPGGVSLVQSIAIARYLAKKHGYNGSNDQEATHIDVINEGVSDFFNKFVEVFYKTEDSKKAEAQDKAVRDFLPNQLNIFGGFLDKNGTGFLVGNKPSYADLALFQALRAWHAQVNGAAGVIDGHASIKNFLDKIGNRQHIKAFYDSNPYGKK